MNNKMLNKLILMVEESLQFLNAFCFSLKKEIMFVIGHSYQVLWSVIVSNTIEVMNYPSLWQRFLVSLFPDKNVLKDITISRCSMVFRHIYLDITKRSLMLATLPITILLTLLEKSRCLRSCFPFLFTITTLASFSCIITQLTTIQTRMPVVLKPLLQICSFIYNHNYIITYC